jgi:hypothetical protein
MRPAVQLDNELGLNANKVADLGSDWHLATKLHANAAISEGPSHDRFGARHFSAQFAGASELLIGKASHGRDMIGQGRSDLNRPHPPLADARGTFSREAGEGSTHDGFC